MGDGTFFSSLPSFTWERFLPREISFRADFGYLMGWDRP